MFPLFFSIFSPSFLHHITPKLYIFPNKFTASPETAAATRDEIILAHSSAKFGNEIASADEPASPDDASERNQLSTKRNDYDAASPRQFYPKHFTAKDDHHVPSLEQSDPRQFSTQEEGHHISYLKNIRAQEQRPCS